MIIYEFVKVKTHWKISIAGVFQGLKVGSPNKNKHWNILYKILRIDK